MPAESILGPAKYGVDVGNKDAEPVRMFETFTADLNRMGDWQAKNVSGRKSDMLDCQWLGILHRYGLLPASFRPAQDIGVLRAYMRHRQMLIEYAAAHVQHIESPDADEPAA